MKKENFNIVKMTFTEDEISSVISMHQKMFCDSILDGRLIYFDVNFRNYLRNLEDDVNNAFYLLKNRFEIIGFIHYKIVDGIVFLNNVYINSSVQGKGLGKFLFKETLGVFLNMEYNNIELDVFNSNTTAYNWYEKLGFQKKSESIWYELSGRKSRNSTALVRRTDGNGFLGLYHDEQKIGTIINNSTFIMNSFDYFDEQVNCLCILFKGRQQDSHRLNELFTQVVDIERSVRLKGILKSVYKKF